MTNFFIKNNHGFSLLEVILSIAVFTIGVVGIGLFMVDISATAERTYNLDQGILLAEEGIEAVKSIRDTDFDLLQNNEYGIEFVGDSWDFTSKPDTTLLGKDSENGKLFTRRINIIDAVDYSDIELISTSSVKLVTSQVSWPIRGATTSVTLNTLITKWK